MLVHIITNNLTNNLLNKKGRWFQVKVGRSLRRVCGTD